MALRFSGSPSSERTVVMATDLPPRAARSLAAGNVESYRELFAELEAVEDPHRRYQATVGLIEQGLAASANTSAARLPELFATAASGAIGALEHQVREPRILNYTGVLFYELWSLDAAQAMFKAAKRLDPNLDQVEGNLTALAKRRKLLRSTRRHAQLHPSLPALAARAQALATSAQPAEGLRLSLCMIVRDEQEMLPRSLAAVADAVDEIVIVDTGSVDNTIDIARSFGAKVIEREWTGSFAEARNVSFDAASGDWLMYLDADEVLVREDAPLLRELTGRTWREAFYLSETNYTGDIEDGTAVTHNAMRVFRNRPDYRFEGRLHEQIANRLPGYLPERFEATGVRVEHYGYLGVVRNAREKSTRNIELLRAQQAEGPPTPFLHYNLGSEYAAAGDAPAALAELERSWELICASPDGDRYEFAPALMSRLVKALRVCGRPQDALLRAQEGLERFPGFTDLVLEQAIAAAALGQTDRAVELYEQCIEMGDAPRRYTATVGSGTYLPRIQLAELRRDRGELDGAVELLEYCVREHPRFIGSVLPYASALLASGMPPKDVVAKVETHIPDLAPGARFMLATALYESGATACGEEQFRAVVARQPHSARARVALGEALLAQRRYADAAVVASAVPVEDPLAAMASRTEIFARIAGGDGERTTAALARARLAGLPVAELELLQAWHRLTSSGKATLAPVSDDTRMVPVSGEDPLALSPEALPLLVTMMEALLRVQDFDNFELLHGLLARIPVDARERRQLLAEMYLRRGFLASAAEEWMAVCKEQESDVRALVGLARVAAAQGMDREAGDFAAAALSHEPHNQAAAELLAEAKSAVA